MTNLFKMDLYRMRRARAFYVCLGLAFFFALSQTPLEMGLLALGRLLGAEAVPVPKSTPLSQLLSDPFPVLNGMLVMLSACFFFYADMENGFIKNIAGQVPQKGLTILSRFLAVILHHLLFMAAGILGSLIGTVIFRRVELDDGVTHALLVLLLKLCLMQSVCSILLLVTASFANKSLGTVLAVLMGLGLLSLVYMGLDSLADQVWKNKGFLISDYMPDQLLGAADPGTVRALAVSAVTIAVFLPLSVRVFDKKDVK